MDRIIKFKGELESKTKRELIRLQRRYVDYFSDCFCEYYKIRHYKKAHKTIPLSKTKELQFRIFELTCFLCMPDEESYEKVKDFIREEDFRNYFKITQILFAIES